jgi:hypothetical protein
MPGAIAEVSQQFLGSPTIAHRCAGLIEGGEGFSGSGISLWHGAGWSVGAEDLQPFAFHF